MFIDFTEKTGRGILKLKLKLEPLEGGLIYRKRLAWPPEASSN